MRTRPVIAALALMVASIPATLATQGVSRTAIAPRAFLDQAAIDLLLEHGAVINAVDVRRQTPIYGAIMWGWNDVVTHLASRGARLDVKDVNGMTVIDAALGKAGGIGRGNTRVDVREDTAALLRSLIESGGRP